MPWFQEELIGTKDGSNKDFTVTHAPIAASVLISHQGTRLRQVAAEPQPEQFQFGVSGTAVKLGRAPAAGEFIFARYFYVE